MKRFRKLALLLVVLILSTVCLPIIAAADEESSDTVSDNPNLSSNNAVVAYSADDGQLLWANRKDERVAPTVATKLVTAMVVMDILKEIKDTSANVYVTVSQEALDNCGNIFDPRIPTMNLTAGKTYSTKDLLAATLVNNAYDAASALAYYYGDTYCGGIDGFVKKMNEKAKSIGLTSTNFVNATGVDNSEQYTTPYEVAMIATAFYQYNELVNYSDVESFTFNGSTVVRNKNFLKNEYNVKGYKNKNAIGLIAGQLDKKGNYCLITAVQDKGRTYILVVMCASGMKIDEERRWSFVDGNAYDDMNKLISWMFDSFELLMVADVDKIVGELRVDFGNSSDHVMVVPSEKVERLVLKNGAADVVTTVNYDTSIVYKKEFNGKEYDTISAPVTHGQKVGTITFSYNGVELATVDAIVKDAVEEDGVLSGLNSIKTFLFGPVMMTIIYIIGGIIAVYIIIVIVMAVVRMVRKSRISGNGSDKEPRKASGDGSEKTAKPNKPKKKKSKKDIPEPRSSSKNAMSDTKEIL